MKKYKITIEEITEYPETCTRYDAADGKRYTSTYSIPEGVDYKEFQMPTGATITRGRDVYEQEFEADTLTPVIKAVNKLND